MRRTFFTSALLLLCLSVHTSCRAQGRTESVVRQGSARSRVPLSATRKSASALSSQPVVVREDLEIPILVYHHIRPTGQWKKTTMSWQMSVSPKVFEEQMKWLNEKGYTTISMDTLHAILTRKETGPEKPAVITFDDNNLSTYDVALSILQKYGHTATYYIIAKKLDNPNVINKERVLDLHAKGMDIQSHGMTHGFLTKMEKDQLVWELEESRRLLEELTGKPVRHIAYPYTTHNEAVRKATADAGYLTATILNPRRVTMEDELMRLSRITMTDDTALGKMLP